MFRCLCCYAPVDTGKDGLKIFEHVNDGGNVLRVDDDHEVYQNSDYQFMMSPRLRCYVSVDSGIEGHKIFMSMMTPTYSA